MLAPRNRVGCKPRYCAPVLLLCALAAGFASIGHAAGRPGPHALAPVSTQADTQAAARIEKADIFTSAPFASAHASTVVELQNGDWLAAWFGGSAEGKPDVAIWSARHTKQGWTVPALLVREPTIACWNPVLFHTRDGRLWLYYKFGPVVAGWTGARMVSADEGRSWSTPEHLPAGILGPIRAKPYVARDGTVVSGSSVESYHAWAVWIERSRDGGATFLKNGPYTLPARADAAAGQGTVPDPAASVPSLEQATTGLIQPSVVALSGKHLRFYARSSSNIGRICVADSYDAGRSWTAPRALDLPNPNSGIDAVALADGRIALIYNPSTTGRSPLALALSRDGEHFHNVLVLEDTPGQEFSYPALIQLRNGDLLMTYTWHRTRIRAVRVPLSAIASIP